MTQSVVHLRPLGGRPDVDLPAAPAPFAPTMFPNHGGFGLPKLARVVELFARSLQVRLTTCVADWLDQAAMHANDWDASGATAQLVESAARVDPAELESLDVSLQEPASNEPQAA